METCDRRCVPGLNKIRNLPNQCTKHTWGGTYNKRIRRGVIRPLRNFDRDVGTMRDGIDLSQVLHKAPDEGLSRPLRILTWKSARTSHYAENPPSRASLRAVSMIQSRSEIQGNLAVAQWATLQPCRFIPERGPLGFSLLASNTLGSNRMEIFRHATRKLLAWGRWCRDDMLYSQSYVLEDAKQESAQLRPRDVVDRQGSGEGIERGEPRPIEPTRMRLEKSYFCATRRANPSCPSGTTRRDAALFRSRNVRETFGL